MVVHFDKDLAAKLQDHKDKDPCINGNCLVFKMYSILISQNQDRYQAVKLIDPPSLKTQNVELLSRLKKYENKE